MLKNLSIENIAVIEKADIDFSAGLQVLTGETGAGKSIIIDAINAVLGHRTSKELIRTGCETACVCALFENLSAQTVKALSDVGVDVDENGCLLIRRVLSLKGNGSVKINGVASSVGVLKEIGKYLVDIHGQHDNIGLLDPDNHLAYLDLIADNSNEKAEYYAEFRHLNAVRRELASIETDEDEKFRQSELLKYQIKELSDADIHIGEYKELKQKLTAADSFEQTVRSIGTAEAFIIGDDDTDGALTLVKNAHRELLTLKNDKFDGPLQKIADSITLLEETVYDIRSYLSQNSISSEETDKIRERLDLIYKLMLKYGGNEESAVDFLSSATVQLQEINLSDQRIAELSDELDASTERLILLAEKLTKTRIAAAKSFSDNVTSVLHTLDMPNAKFEVRISSGKYTKFGCDEAEFFIGTNVGEDIKPLQKIASGGELSRIMLAIKSVLAEKDTVDTLIFDEIDSGISGRAASKVGTCLLGVAGDRQVLCVTHLAQIAAFADTHLFISKSTDNGRTYTSVNNLTYDEKIREIARIMSGTDMTENLYNSAKELLDRSKDNGNL